MAPGPEKGGPLADKTRPHVTDEEMGNISDDRARWLSDHVLPHEGALRAWLRRRAYLGLDIDDIVQEAYARLAMLDDVAHIAAPKAYFFQCAYSILLADQRRSRIISIEAFQDGAELDIESGDPLPDQQAETREELRQVSQAIEALPTRCREVFLLRKVQGLSQKDVAKKMGLSESSVEKHVAAGIRKLLDSFAHRGDRPVRAPMAQPMSERLHEKRN